MSKRGKWIARAVVIALLDIILIWSSFFAALLLRFDFSFSAIGKQYLDPYLKIMPLCAVGAVILFVIFKLYHSIWRFASISELERIIKAWVVFTVATAVIVFIDEKINGIRRLPISVWIIGILLAFMSTAILRFGYRFLRFMTKINTRGRNGANVMIIGAGECGKDVIHEIVMSQHLNAKVCCAIDDNPTKKGREIDGVPIVGNRYDIPKMVGKYQIDEIIFAIPDARGVDRKDILDICSSTGCKVRVIPGIYQMIDGSVTVNSLRNVQIEDLLGRDPVKVNMKSIRTYITGKTVMVTGGGGSIGSELCRQIAKAEPKLLIIFDIYENNAFWIERELREKYGDKLNMIALIGSVRNTNRVNSVMEQYHPEIIFHAAAHKHVPLMEISPNEAIKNNVGGTYKMAKAALKWGVERFVLISTDKAVNPTNIMGASKRICEMVIQMMDREAQRKHDNGEAAVRTNYSAVRFGNVIGSNGSVLKIFEQQIAHGGPITVTDKNIIRYFMTIPEAVALVMESGAYARGGEIFVLDMGEPVRIDDVARKMIKLSGLVPDVDIKIEYTGLRPGEKLYEERLMDEEGLRKMEENPEISIAEPIPMNDEEFAKQLKELDELAKGETKAIRRYVAGIVSTYKPGTEPEETEENAYIRSTSEASEGRKTIPFSPPDISEKEIDEVAATMRSGWITTGPRVKLLERRLAAYIETGKNDLDTENDVSRWNNRVVCLNSATAAEELNLRILGIREGDEVIVPAYTYTASASAAIHCGATVKFVDIQKDGDPVTHMPEIDYDAVEKCITSKTKAIILVDLAGIVCDYERIYQIAEKTRSLFKPVGKNGDPLTDLASDIQTAMGRIAVVADCAHSLGASRIVDGERRYCGSLADFSSFSFHAVKNLTTAEGGASTWRTIEGIDNSTVYKMYQLMSLHGQNKDALAKTNASAWEYDIVGPWYKCNMTDITAAIGLRQLDRYADMLKRRADIIARYDKACDELGIGRLVHHTDIMDSSNHLYLIRVPGITVERRNEIIAGFAERGIATNVHYKPIPMMSAYKRLGWDIKDFPNSYDYYSNLITLPLNTKLTDSDVDYVIDNLKTVIFNKDNT